MFNDKIVLFYLEQGNDHKNRSLKKILSVSNYELEITHDYIQWLFPLSEASNYNINAPIVTENTIMEFENNSILVDNLKKSFYRMLDFYGLEIDDEDEIYPSYNYFDVRSKIWLTKNNHNYLRLTRILKSLKLLGLKKYSHKLCECLISDCIPKQNITEENIKYWVKASWK